MMNRRDRENIKPRSLISILLAAVMVFGLAACSAPVEIGDSPVALSAPSEDGSGDGGGSVGEGDGASGGDDDKASAGGEEPGAAGGEEGAGDIGDGAPSGSNDSPGNTDPGSDPEKEEPEPLKENADDVNDVPLLTKEKIGVNAFDMTPGVSGYYTVTFEVDGQPDKEVMVAEGDTCAAQPTPVKAEHIFKGWFYMDGSTQKPFSFTSTIIMEDMTVTAEFEPAELTVKFLSADPLDKDVFVLYTAGVSYGDALGALRLDFPESSIPYGMVFNGEWINAADGSPFIFEDPVEENLILRPEFKDGYRVWFISHGSPVEPQIVIAGDYADEPEDPKRTGYSFSGKWYTKEDCLPANEFDFPATKINSDITLYAGWSPDSVGYTVNYWLEKAGVPINDGVPGGGLSDAQRKNMSNFGLVHKETRSGLTGQTASVPETGVPATAITNIRSIMKSVHSSGTKNFAHYVSSTSVAIKGDGTTVVDVFYERNVMTVVFNLGTSNTNIKSMTITKGGKPATYYPGPEANQYSELSKIGLRLYCPNAHETESGVTVDVQGQSGGINYQFFSWGPHNMQSGISFLEWIYPATNTTYFDSASDNKFVLNMRIIADNIYPYEDHHMLASLDQTSPVDEANGRYCFEGKYFDDTIAGYGKLRLATNRGASTPQGYIPFWKSGDALRNQGYKAIPGSPTTFTLDTAARSLSNFNPYYKVYFFYTRELYSIVFDLQGGAMTGAASINNIPFQKDISSYLPSPEPVCGDDLFLGWFDENGIEFNFGGKTMPPNNVLLTAHWLVDPCPVAFFSDPTGSIEVTGFSQLVSYDTQANDPGALDPEDWGRAKSDKFIGWYVKLKSGALVPYSFDMPVTAGLALYARWDPPYTPYRLGYDLDGGGAGTAPVDPLKYASGVLATVADGDGFVKGDMVFVGWKKAADDTLLHGGNKVLIKGDTTLTAVYAPKNKTVTIKFLPNGGKGAMASWVSVQKAFATWPDATDLDFTRAGHTFIGWSELKNAVKPDPEYAPLGSSEIASDITLYAVWKANAPPPAPPTTPLVTPPVEPPVEPPEPPVEPPVVPPVVAPPGVEPPGVTPPVNPPSEPPVNPQGNPPVTPPVDEIINVGGAGGLAPLGDAPTPEEVLGHIMEAGLPTISVGGLNIPLAAGAGLSHLVWALVNLMLAIAGAVLVIAAILRYKGHNGDIIETSPLCPEDEKQEKKRRPGWLALLTVMGIVGVIVFVLTEDMTRLMVLVDNWTIVNAIVFVVALISYRFAFKREEEDEYDGEEATAYEG